LIRKIGVFSHFTGKNMKIKVGDRVKFWLDPPLYGTVLQVFPTPPQQPEVINNAEILWELSGGLVFKDTFPEAFLIKIEVKSVEELLGVEL
jgi:hypothetical protein